jgi:hypothetical protein
VESQKSYDKSRMISIETMVSRTLYDIAIGKREERFGDIFPIQKWTPMILAVYPSIMDYFVKKLVKAKL